MNVLCFERRYGQGILSLLVVALTACSPTARSVLRVETDPQSPAITYLSWDTEGGEQASMNLLRSGSVFRVRISGQWLGTQKLPLVGESEDGLRRYRLSAAPDIGLTLIVEEKGDDLLLTMTGAGAGLGRVEAVELIFPFNPRVTATTVLPSRWAKDGTLRLPAIISAPDFGQMILIAEPDTPQRRVIGRMEGNREKLLVNFVLQLPPPTPDSTLTLRLRPWVLPAPKGLKDRAMWKAARRGWFNPFQCTAQWGDQNVSFSSPSGIQANNVISDPCSMLLYKVADAALLVPELAPGISTMEQVRYSIDWWLDDRMLESGEIIGYRGNYHDFMDTNASLLISAWDYVEATGDMKWLERRIDTLEFVGKFIVGRDTDGDGLYEAVQSGNAGTLIEPNRSCAAFDAINCGHKDAYCNAVIYRGWRCLADLEAKLGRARQQAYYRNLADRLKEIYAKTLINPHTGFVSWWKSQDGQLHEFASPIVNGVAIQYGLIDPEQGRRILSGLRAKMQEAGFKRPELGLPCTLIPIPRADYLLPRNPGDTVPGGGKLEDGSDSFGTYLNGGIFPGTTLDFLAAHYVLGENVHADKILRAMLKRQTQGAYPNGSGFQNGIVNSHPHGAEVTDWEGNPNGYEGYHTYNFRWLLAVLLREPEYRQRLYRPLE